MYSITVAEEISVMKPSTLCSRQWWRERVKDCDLEILMVTFWSCVTFTGLVSYGNSAAEINVYIYDGIYQYVLHIRHYVAENVMDYILHSCKSNVMV